MNFEKMRLYPFLLGLFFLVLSQAPSHAQADLTSWTAVQLEAPVNKKMSFVLKPIMRHISDLSDYSDTSIDLILKYKFSAKWSGLFLQRHFFIPEQGDRQFLFFDLIHHTWNKNAWKFNQGLRYHFAADHNREDPEFIRYRPNLSYKVSDKLGTFLELDAFVRQSPFKLSGARYTVGASYKLSRATSLTLIYWRQDGYPDMPIGETHNIYTTLGYKFLGNSSKG